MILQKSCWFEETITTIIIIINAEKTLKFSGNHYTFFSILWWIEILKEQHSFELEIIYKIYKNPISINFIFFISKKL